MNVVKISNEKKSLEPFKKEQTKKIKKQNKSSASFKEMFLKEYNK